MDDRRRAMTVSPRGILPSGDPSFLQSASTIARHFFEIQHLPDSCFSTNNVEDRVLVLEAHMEKCFDTLRTGRMVDRVWWLLISGALLGVMGRAFQWL